MLPLLAETVPHRARLAWYTVILAAATLAFALSRPVHGHHHHHTHGLHTSIGHCVEMMPSAPQVHAFYVHY